MEAKMFVLRDYQRASIDALYGYWGNGGGNGLIVLPTGSGKSLVIAALCQEILRDYPTMRIGIITHVRELIAQDHKELLALWPEAPAGIYSAGLNRRDTRHKILFMGIQSVFKRTDKIGLFDLLLIDEAHLVSHSETTMYRKFIDAQRAGMPDIRICGLTATPFRLDTGRLDKGFGKLFDDIVYDANVKTLIEQGWLCKLISKATKTKLSVEGVGKRGGEFIASQLEAAVDQEELVREAVSEARALGEDRRSWLVFCVTVNHGKHVCAELNAQGVHADQVYGTTPKAERDAIIERFRRGEITALVSVMVLGIGFNVPAADLIALLRPTQSAGLFVQQVGRGLRQAQGKTDCLVLDFAGNTKRLGPIDLVGSDKVHKVIECPKCASLMSEHAKACPDCGYVWPVEEPKEAGPPKPRLLHDAKADAEAEIVSTGEPQWVRVTGMRCSVHRKWNQPGALPTMRVDYQAGIFNTYSEWVCLSHPAGSYPREKATAWWRQNIPDGMPLALSVEEGMMMSEELRCPSEIRVAPDGRYFRIVARRFAEELV
jgi:DNA repair protein RadD